MIKQIPFAGSNSFIDMEVAEDCVVFASRCLCHEIATHAKLMIEETQATGMTKIVIVGDCDEHDEWHEGVLAEIMKAAGMEHVWLADDGLFIHQVMPGFSETAVKRFGAAADFGKLRVLLDSMGRKVHEIQSKISYEANRLAEYPIIAKVQSIESHAHGWISDDWKEFFKLFGISTGDLVAEAHAVMLLNLETKKGLLVTKSQEFKFTLAEPLTLNELQNEPGMTVKGKGSVKVRLGEKTPKLSIYCEPGVWKISPHPELQVMDPNVHYEPMWKRVVKA